MTGQIEVLGKIRDVLLAEDDFLISTHLYPDGDAVCSELALYQALTKMGKQATIVNDTPLGDTYGFLPFSDRIQCLADMPANGRYETLISLDCGRDYRLGQVLPHFRPRRIINIDHHISNDGFGELNLVRPKASSTGELILDLAVACGVEVDAAMATCIYTAILSDTGRFCYSNTTPRAHEIAARMIAIGVSPADISRQLFRCRSLGQLRVDAAVVETLDLSEDGRVAWASLTHQMCERAGCRMLETLECVLIPISMRGVVIGLLFREADEPGHVKLSLRSEGSGPDVSQIARRFGGGGHPNAAGCTLEGTVEQVRDRIVPQMLEVVDQLAPG